MPKSESRHPKGDGLERQTRNLEGEGKERGLGKMKCPGQNGANWKPEDVFEIPCTGCGSAVEFFKDDKWRECPACGLLAKNPHLDLGCAQWCAAGDQCQGSEPRKTENREG